MNPAGLFDNRAFSENPFRFHGEDSVLNPRDIGIAGDRTSVLTPEEEACSVRCLQSCPWSATGFAASLAVDGELIPGREWMWLPNMIRRSGMYGDWEASSLTLLPPQRNGCILFLALKNRSEHPIHAPLALILRGSPRKTEAWEFNIPSPGPAHFAAAEIIPDEFCSRLRLTGGSDDVEGREVQADDAVIALACSLPGMTLFRNADMWETAADIGAGETLYVTLTFSIGAHHGGPEEESLLLLREAEKEAERAFAWLSRETERILSRVPVLHADDPALEQFYYRSLVTYSLNRWDNPLYAIRPFYSTGSVNGGCMCSYLWDYGGGLMLHPLIDPETNKKMIRAYLHDDLTVSYAIKPLDGGPSGVWYHINQEKVISMIYYHVLHTGEKEFLRETVDGKTIRDWAVFHALVGDDLSRPQQLVDFGEMGKSHLELRRRYVYQGVMPDLNARRYLNYLRAYELTVLDGTPEPVLTERAEALKPLLASLWDPDAKWYDYIWEGKREKRYTVQMFKFLNSPVIDEKTRAALVSHLNEREFLSKFGLHSIAKTDPGYDQIDIDNGGGGICTLFTMQIAGQLYDTGYAAEAADLLRRVLWWGTRLPYWGDSCAANYRKVREDTPLQADISSASGAQMLIFNLCGIRASFDGGVTVCPAKVLPCRKLSFENVRLLGHTFSVFIDGASYTLVSEGGSQSASLGERLTVS